MTPLLQVRDLRTQFFTRNGVVKAVDGVSFDINRGETLGLVGESGCGKSATALSLMRLIAEPQGKIVSGEIILDGQNILELSSNNMRALRGRRMAMIFQEPMTSLNPVLTIGRQLTESMETHLGIRKSEAKLRAITGLGQVGIPDPERRMHEYPHQFSGGMLQRVMIAIALSCGPELIVADEPTTALDVTIQAQVLELLKQITYEKGVSLLLITHNLGIVARYADNVHIMYAGKFVEQGPVNKIYKFPSHPYTIGLLKSIPRLDMPIKNRLFPIDGQPPDLINLPMGCSFLERCQYAVGRCGKEIPQLMAVDENHFSACFVDRPGSLESGEAYN